MYQWSINIGPSSLGPAREPAVDQGLFTGTLVAAERGWVPVEELVRGDRIWTFDAGLQVLQNIRARVPRPGGKEDASGNNRSFPVINVPAGALANERDLLLLPGQGLLIESENASDAYGDPFAVVPVAALESVFGISRKSAPRDLKLHELVFAEEQAIYIDSGLIAHCPARSGAGAETRYDVRTKEAAKEMLSDLDLAELALREPDEEFFGEMAADRVA